MKKGKIFALVLAVMMALSVLPIAAAAEEIGYQAHENYMLGMFDDVWAKLDAVEAEALASGAEPGEVTMAVYRAALTNPLVDEGSVTDLDSMGFFFRVNGMLGGYNYESRNVRIQPMSTEAIDAVVEAASTRAFGNESLNVLLIGPYYGYDGSFTNQYRNEADTIGAYTQGQVTKIEGHAATGPAIAAAEPNAGVIIYDSHGTAGNGTSYLCLTTNSGLTSTDFSNGWAYNGGSSDAGIDGRYIQNHITEPLPNSFIWMAICEGMKLSGHGVTGYALLEAGAGIVYGYSQSVTFAGDYIYEATFWNHMRQGETASEALEAMKAAHGIPDPYGDAYPIMMSADDPFPANPDGPQTTNTDWHLNQPGDLVVTDATSLTFEQTNYGVAPTFTVKIEPIINPEGANNFTSTWTSSNPSVATVSKKGVVTGVTPGTATITLNIESTENSNTSYAFTASATVTVSNEYLPVECMYMPVTDIIPGESYLIGYVNGTRSVIMSNEYYDANHVRNMTAVPVNMTSIEGRTCIVEGVTANEEWVFSADNGGTIRNVGNGQYLTLSGNYLVLGEEGIAWNWDPETGYITNDVNSYFKYLGTNNSASYFGVFIGETGLQLFRKLSRESSNPQIAGDIDNNGIVNANDALLVLRAALNLIQLTDAQNTAADVDGNGVINANDALIIVRMALGV